MAEKGAATIRLFPRMMKAAGHRKVRVAYGLDWLFWGVDRRPQIVEAAGHQTVSGSLRVYSNEIGYFFVLYNT
jgi:hypothetical protein